MQVEKQDAYASDLLHASKYSTLSPADHGLATEIVMGVLRWRSPLDAEIKKFSSQKWEKLDLEVLTSLRMAVYQMFWLDRIPAHAAVHDSVELVKRVRKRSASGFVNALLRKIMGHVEWAHQLRHALDELHDAQKEQGSPGPTVLTAPPQPTPQPERYIASRYSHPWWLVERWVNAYGYEKMRAICRADQQIPVTAIRVPSPADEKQLEAAGVILNYGKLLKSAARLDCGDLTSTAPFREGRIAIQDEASQLVALLVGTGEKILDCCAAPGGKTRLLAQQNPASEVVAVELHPHRARLLRERVPEANVQVVTADIRDYPPQAKFNRVLADVPCSGTGTLAHNPEIKWRLEPQDLAGLHQSQVAILKSAMQQVASGGTLVYSTCSLEREENEDVIAEVLSTGTSFRVLDCRNQLTRLRDNGELVWKDLDSLLSGPYLRTIPGIHPCDGFFAAILGKD
jgi:16S rRNA (cytosine967-C5)-methyltransferase